MKSERSKTDIACIFYFCFTIFMGLASCDCQKQNKIATSQEKKQVKDKKKKIERKIVVKDGRECFLNKKQTGPGCDMNGVIAAVKPDLKPNGRIQKCYRMFVNKPGEGKIVVKFTINKYGLAENLQIIQDDFQNKKLEECIKAVFGSIRYPSPGDIPCTVIYPLPIIAGRGTKE